jgi:hypothetical protein
MLGAQCPYQRILNEIIGDFRVARERPRVASQRRDRRLQAVPERAHILSPCRSPRAVRTS